MIRHQTEFRLVPNRSAKCNYDPDFGSEHQDSENIFPCVYSMDLGELNVVDIKRKFERSQSMYRFRIQFDDLTELN